MKKFSLAAIIAVMLSAGFALQTQAQPKAINIESFSAFSARINAPVKITEMPVYDKAGKLLYTVKRYNESALPKDISRMVRNQYYDFDIIGVEEVTFPSNSNSIYFVHIGNDKNLETVKVYNGESEVVHEYKKG
ncbi:MAG: hypothetical protein ABI405_04430 [Parafilimonas sp.]